jgi:hypothetical protein
MRPIPVVLARLPAAGVIFVQIHLMQASIAVSSWLGLYLVQAFKTLVLCGLALVPAIVVRRRALGTWVVFAASMASSLPLFPVVRDGLVSPAPSLAVGSDPFLLSAVLYAATIALATLWDVLARPVEGPVARAGGGMQRMPKPRTLLPGLAAFLALTYAAGRYGFLANNPALNGIPGWWRLEFEASPDLLAALLFACVLTLTPALIVRRHARGSAVVCTATFVAGLPFYLMVPEWAGKTFMVHTDPGDFAVLALICAFLYGATVLLAVLWDILATCRDRAAAARERALA